MGPYTDIPARRKPCLAGFRCAALGENGMTDEQKMAQKPT
jgi:hypothetical protein